jgi:hypothetical protein
MERAVTSVEPPAAAFTIIRIGFVGQAWTVLFALDCAEADGANVNANTAAVKQMKSGCMCCLPYIAENRELGLGGSYPRFCSVIRQLIVGKSVER